MCFVKVSFTGSYYKYRYPRNTVQSSDLTTSHKNQVCIMQDVGVPKNIHAAKAMSLVLVDSAVQNEWSDICIAAADHL